MSKNTIVFFHGGGGQNDYSADKLLVDSLKAELGSGWLIHYPLLEDEDTPDLGRRDQIERTVRQADDNVILIAHSLGASMLLAYLSERRVRNRIKGIFLLACPFWSGDQEWVEPFKLRPDFAEKLNRSIPVHFYHCMDDEEVPFSQMNTYRQLLPWATFRAIPTGGHQFNNDMAIVACDVKSLL
jgi:uncharacterized protein